MQTYENDELKATEIFEEKTLSQKLQSIEATLHVVIGKLPKKGQEIKINGLVFKVIYSDFVRGIIHAKLKWPSD